MPVLTDLLHGGATPRAQVLDAFQLARRRFIAAERLDMSGMAAELGISRVTLNRWVGSRDLLLAEIIWSLAVPTLEQERAASSNTGGRLVADVVAGLLRATLAAPYMQRFLHREPEIAMRVLTTDHAPFQRRLAAWTADLINEEIPQEQHPLPAVDLGYLVIRIGESFGYIDLIAGGRPDPDKAREAIAALLRGP